MQTKQAIQSSANVIRITSIEAGDVYKRFEDSYSSNTYYGIVKAIHNDGEKTIIEATEYRYGYSTLDVEHKILMGDEDYTLFPCDPEELNLEFEKARKNKVKDIENAEEKIEEAKKCIKDIDEIMSGEKLKNLKAASYKELTQQEYQKKLEEISG